MDEAIRNTEVDKNIVKAVTGRIEDLSKAECDVKYIVKEIVTEEEEMKEFLFTLGCYPGEEVTVISVLAENYVIAVKDARYSIDRELASAVKIK